MPRKIINLKADRAPAPITLGVTTFLAIMGQLNAVFKNKPNGSYLTSLDIWLVVCDIFVFATLIEYSICQVSFIIFLIKD